MRNVLWLIYRISNRFASVRFEKYVTWFLTFARVVLFLSLASFACLLYVRVWSLALACISIRMTEYLEWILIQSLFILHLIYDHSKVRSDCCLALHICFSFSLRSLCCDLVGFSSTIGAHLHIKSRKSVANKIMTNKTKECTKKCIYIFHAVTLLGKREYFYKWNRSMRNLTQHKKLFLSIKTKNSCVSTRKKCCICWKWNFFLSRTAASLLTVRIICLTRCESNSWWGSITTVCMYNA